MTDRTPPPVVVDASAALALELGEPAAPSVQRWIAGHRARAGRLLVPDLFWFEVVNVLNRRHGADADVIVATLQGLDDLGFESFRLERPLLLLGLDAQVRFGLSAYDAAYLALAESEDARLLTLDERLRRAAGERAVPLDGRTSHRLAEEPASYGGEPVDWTRFGPYLAHLRAQAKSLPTRAAARR